MPIRLPEQQFIGVQSLGREDVLAPQRGAGQVAKALQEGLANVTAWAEAEQKQQLANSVGDYKREANDLQRELTKQDTVNVKDSRWKGFEFSEEDRKHFETVKDPETGEERTVIAGWRVMDRLYDYGEGKIRGKLTEKMNGNQRQAFNRQVSDFTITASNKVVGQQYRDRHAHLKTRFSNAYEASVSNGDEQTARLTAREAFKTGAWNIDEYEQAMQEIGGRVDGLWYNGRFQKASQDGDLEVMEELMHEVWADPTNRMSGEAKLRFQAQAFDEMHRQKRVAFDASERARKRRSAQTAAGLVGHIQENGYVDWGQLRDSMIHLEPEDQRTVMTINANATYGPERSDDAVVRQLEALALGLRSPAPGVSMDQRIAGIKGLMRQATGMNADGEPTGPSRLSNADYTRILGMIDDSVAAPFKDPRVQRVEDRLFMVITKAGKAQFGFNTSGEAATRMNEVLMKYHRAIDAAGDRFDPEAWYDQNREMIESETYKANLTDQVLNEMSPYIIRNKDRSIDVEATQQKLLEALNAGNLEKDKAQKYLDAILPPTG